MHRRFPRSVWQLPVLLATPIVVAAPSPINLVSAGASCPSASMVATQLRSLVGAPVTVGGARLSEAVEVQLGDDQGAGYWVQVGGLRRDFREAERRCHERARQVAVVVALALAPPAIPAIEDSKGPPAAAAAVARPPLPQATPFPTVRLEVGGTVAAAAIESLVTAGGSFRLAVGGRNVQSVAGVSGMAPVLLALPAATAQIVRIPLELALRLGLERRHWSVAGDLGMVVSLLQVSGIDVPNAAEELRAEIGMQGRLLGQYWFGRWAVFVACHGAVIPVPYQLMLQSQGLIGSTPIAWLGGELGLAVRLR